MGSSVCAILNAIIFVGVIILVFFRWKYINVHCLSEEDCKKYSILVVDDIFEHAASVGKQVPIGDAYWRYLNISEREWVYLCKWMSGKGVVEPPDDWGMISIMLNVPPKTLALTSKSWELKMREGTTVTNIGILGDGNAVGGSMNVGGWQNNGGEVTNENSLTASDILKLVEALRADENSLTGIDRAQIRATADFLEKEIHNGVSPDTMEGDLGKVVTKVSEIMKTGASLMGATVSVLKSFGFE